MVTNMKKKVAEAKEKWGNTSAYKEHVEKTKNYSKQKWDSLACENIAESYNRELLYLYP